MSEGTPYVSLQRTLVILLLVYGVGAVFALLAGAALVAHVDPYSECILFSHLEGQKLYYGSEACKYLTQYSSSSNFSCFQIARPSDISTLGVLWALWSCFISLSSTGVS